MKKRILGLALAAGMLAAAILVFRKRTVNDWEIRNLPVGSGPVLCFGDSLVAGTGAESRAESYPGRLEALLGRPVVAHGTPGQTAEEGSVQVRRQTALRASLVIVTLGGNDVLRRIPLADTVSALRDVFAEFQSRGAVVAFTAVEGIVPGQRREAYRGLCREQGVILVPNVLDGILGDDDLRADQVHPNGKGYAVMAERVAAAIAPYLRVSSAAVSK